MLVCTRLDYNPLNTSASSTDSDRATRIDMFLYFLNAFQDGYGRDVCSYAVGPFLTQ